MIQHCRQSWEESETTIGHGPSPTTAPPLTHQGEGPAKQREITPLGLTTHTTRTTTTRQLKMESSQHNNIPAKERDLVKSEVDGGTNNPQYSQEPAQGRETGRANERKQYPAENPLDLTVVVPTQGAKRSANKKKSRDSETTGPPPQAMVSIGNARTEKEGLQSHNKEGNTPNLSDEIPTSKDTEPIAKDMVHSPIRLEDTTDPSHQAGVDMERSSTGNDGLCPHGRIGQPERPDKGPRRKDPDSNTSKKSQSQPCKKVRTALNGTEPPLCHTPDHSLTPIIKGGRG